MLRTLFAYSSGANRRRMHWVIRGNSRRLAIDHGLPVKYDRLAVMAVSIFHLSHWRCDVTVANYLLAV